MIFVTVGTDQPFDRMLKIIDAWASEKKHPDVFAQIGEGGWKPLSFPSIDVLSPQAFLKQFKKADLIVAHAGMGTILSALHHGKRIIVMPKLASLLEHRNEHQLATAKQMKRMGYVNVALSDNDLIDKLDTFQSIVPHQKIPPCCSGTLISKLREFIKQS